jgi:hypothetical protein
MTGRTYARLSALRRGRFAGAVTAKYAALRIWLRRTTVGYRAARSARQANVVNAELSIHETE